MFSWCWWIKSTRYGWQSWWDQNQNSVSPDLLGISRRPWSCCICWNQAIPRFYRTYKQPLKTASTVALLIFRIILALFSGTLVPKVPKPYARSIKRLIWFGPLVKVKKWLAKCSNIFISGPLPVKLPTKKIVFIWRGGFRTISKPVCWFLPLSAFWTLLARSCQETVQLLIEIKNDLNFFSFIWTQEWTSVSE